MMRFVCTLMLKSCVWAASTEHAWRFPPSWPRSWYRYEERLHATVYSRELSIVVDRLRARFSAWYEMFPRSTAAEPGRHGTFADVEARLPYIAKMGFDVLYLPPIHPIGRQFRKGRNNTSRPSRATRAARGLSGLPRAV